MRKGKASKKFAASATRARAQHRFLGLKSLDDKTVVFAFLAFLVIVLFVLDAIADQKALSTRQGQVTQKALTKEMVGEDVIGKLIINSREEDGVGFVVKDAVDQELLEKFTNKSYEEIKRELGINADFIIHFEDLNGNVIPIGNKMCIGSKSASVNGVPCS